MANEKKTSRKKFRVAVSGVTADGREINGDMLKAAATSYNPSVYGARVNIEHILSPLPGSEFSAMGDVVGLSTEDITDGPLAGRTALYAEIEPTARMMSPCLTMVKKFTPVLSWNHSQPSREALTCAGWQ